MTLVEAVVPPPPPVPPPPLIPVPPDADARGPVSGVGLVESLQAVARMAASVVAMRRDLVRVITSTLL
jgi:hypothetical protein